MSAARLTAHGKQVKLDGKHFADACTEDAATAITHALEPFLLPMEEIERIRKGTGK